MGIGLSQIDIAEVIAGSNSVRGALFRMQETGLFSSEPHAAYEYLLWPWSHVRGDLLNATTLHSSVGELYYPNGGTNADPVVDQLARGESFLEIDLAAVLADSKSKYFANPFLTALRDQGYVSLASWCISGGGMIGFGAFTLIESAQQIRKRPDTQDMLAFVASWHETLRRMRLLGAHFQVNKQEARTLEFVAAGRTAEDIAVREDVRPRSIELRLQNLRRKLRVRSTSEAIYKAVAYGILPL